MRANARPRATPLTTPVFLQNKHPYRRLKSNEYNYPKTVFERLKPTLFCV